VGPVRVPIGRLLKKENSQRCGAPRQENAMAFLDVHDGGRKKGAQDVDQALALEEEGRGRLAIIASQKKKEHLRLVTEGKSHRNEGDSNIGIQGERRPSDPAQPGRGGAADGLARGGERERRTERIAEREWKGVISVLYPEKRTAPPWLRRKGRGCPALLTHRQERGERRSAHADHRVDIGSRWEERKIKSPPEGRKKKERAHHYLGGGRKSRFLSKEKEMTGTGREGNADDYLHRKGEGEKGTLRFPTKANVVKGRMRRLHTSKRKEKGRDSNVSLAPRRMIRGSPNSPQHKEKKGRDRSVPK